MAGFHRDGGETWDSQEKFPSSLNIQKCKFQALCMCTMYNILAPNTCTVLYDVCANYRVIESYDISRIHSLPGTCIDYIMLFCRECGSSPGQEFHLSETVEG